MHGGTPLTDQDRAPWLATMAAWIDATRKVAPAATCAPGQSRES